MNISISVPSRGQAGEPGSLDAKQKRDSYFRNQRSLTAILKRRIKRKMFRNKCRYFKKSLRKQLSEQNMSSDEIKIKLQKLRKDRRSSARGRHLNDSLQRLDKNIFISNSNISNIDATRGYSVNNKLPRPLINPRNLIYISTINTRTASSLWKLYELTNYCILHSIHILAIQEHRRYFDPTQDHL